MRTLSPKRKQTTTSFRSCTCFPPERKQRLLRSFRSCARFPRERKQRLLRSFRSCARFPPNVNNADYAAFVHAHAFPRT